MQHKLFGFVLIVSVIILCLSIPSTNGREKRKVIGARRLSYIPLYPTECADHLCNRTFNYPWKKMAKFLKKHPIFRLDSVHIRTNDHIASRQFDEEEGMNMCETSQASSKPKAMMAETGEWMFIVNDVANFTQTIEYDKCSEKKGCMFSSHFPDDYLTACKQHRISLKLLSMNHQGEIRTRSFWIPGGCACVYKLQKK